MMIKFIVPRIKCFFGIHDWSHWEYHSRNVEYYDFEEWYERKCKNCGKIEDQSPFGEL